MKVKLKRYKFEAIKFTGTNQAEVASRLRISVERLASVDTGDSNAISVPDKGSFGVWIVKQGMYIIIDSEAKIYEVCSENGFLEKFEAQKG